MDEHKKKNIVIIGGGRRGIAIIETLHEDEQLRIVGIADRNQNPSRIELAKKLGIPTATDFRDLLKNQKVDAILNLSDDPEINKQLQKIGESSNIEIMKGPVTSLLWDRLREKKALAEFERLSKRTDPSVGLEELYILIMNSCIKGTKADAGSLFVFDEKSKQLALKTAWGLNEKIIELIKKKGKEKLQLWREQKLPQPIISKAEGESLPGNLKGMPEIETGICIPLIGREEKLIGLITLHSKKKNRQFLDEEKRLFTTFADYSSQAIENTMLYKSTQQLSITDGLTGLFNHRHFHEQLELEVNRAQRYDLNLSLIMIDLDHFKKFNDSYGHLEGDTLLRKIAQILKSSLRETDFVARYGGEEFAVILPETNKAGASFAAERVRKTINEQTFGEVGAKMTISLGVASYPDDACLRTDLIKKADEALYRAKKEGRNRTCLF
ncbi:diguanylate cyclase [bacterium]|nr:diguanylate cyclase [bacterium]NIN93040.1 diguanylate cyclase [bacterium]NIO18909.1 diguanylate cyclase [bacterium]NIO73990.1 diguanylate cyclase [bacterium]